MTRPPAAAQLAVLAAAFAGAGCTELGSQSVLDRTRILAVRADPAHLPPGATGRIDVLVGDTVGRVFVTGPTRVTPARELPEDVAALAASFVHHDGEAWTITAPGDSVLAEVRVQLGLAPGAPIFVPLDVDVTVDSDPLTAVKVIVVGNSAANPTIGGMTIAGTLATGTVAVPVGEIALAPADVTATSGLSYAWYSSVGEVDDDRRAGATLHADELGPGQLVLVGRDDRLGVAWTIADVIVGF